MSDQHPRFTINIVHFEDNAHALPATYRTLGERFDILAGPFLTDCWKDYFQMLELGRYRLCFAVSRNHRLASRERLSIKDLYGETVAVVNGGKNTVIDEVRSEMKNHPKIRIKDVPRLFDLDVFNRCEESNAVLLTLETWADVHPSLVTIPSDLQLTIPYGLLYPMHPSGEVSQFLGIINEWRSSQGHSVITRPGK